MVKNYLEQRHSQHFLGALEYYKRPINLSIKPRTDYT
jgi:hypothetical protein